MGISQIHNSKLRTAVDTVIGVFLTISLFPLLLWAIFLSLCRMSNDPDPLPSSSKGKCQHLQVEKYIHHGRRGSDKSDENTWRRQCGCLKTSEKLKRILKNFPSPPPPSPSTNAPRTPPNATFENTCISAYCTRMHQPTFPNSEYQQQLSEKPSEGLEDLQKQSRLQRLIFDLVQLVQLSVTATALALYYLIYCYMQLIYYTVRSAMYFHNADGPMKITIGVVTVTSLVVGFNLLLRIERLIGITY